MTPCPPRATASVALILGAATLCTATLGAAAVRAQSYIQLPPSISLDAPAPPAGPAPLGVDCSPGRTDCVGTEGAVRFSLENVVNLGIIDREEASAVAQAGGGDTQQTMSQALPSIDLEVLFDYDSDSLRADQIAQLQRLAEQLRGVSLSQGYLVVMGHTDAVGSADYNDGLSLRRARSVAGFLQGAIGLPGERIRASGQGFRYLKHPEAPTHAANRRVQIILVGQ